MEIFSQWLKHLKCWWITAQDGTVWVNHALCLLTKYTRGCLYATVHTLCVTLMYYVTKYWKENGDCVTDLVYKFNLVAFLLDQVGVNNASRTGPGAHGQILSCTDQDVRLVWMIVKLTDWQAVNESNITLCYSSHRNRKMRAYRSELYIICERSWTLSLSRECH